MQIIFIYICDYPEKIHLNYAGDKIKRKNPKLKSLGLQYGALAEPELACSILIFNVYF